jgi:uncharacterized repeat protein (TIGR01451 family)
VFNLARWLRQTFRASGRTSRTVAPRRPTVRPRLEALEDRLVLSTTWNPIGPAPIANGQTAGNLAVSGRVTGVAADPNNANIIYITAAGGGVWKTINGGTSWTPLTDNVTDSSGNPVPEFMGAIAETDATAGANNGNQIVYAGTGEANNDADNFYGEGILVSTSGGSTWTLENAGGAFSGRTVSKIVIDPSDPTGATAYAAVSDFGTNGTSGNTGIWKTTNYGVTWTNTTATNGLSTTDEWSDVVIDPHTPSTLYAADGTYFGSSSNGVYKSTDGGTTWTLLNGTGSFNGTQDGRIALALYDDGTTNALFVSIAQPTSNASIGGQLYKMLESTNGGTSFTDLTASSTPPPNYMGGTSGGTNYGQGWYDTSLAVEAPATGTISASTLYVFAGGSDNGGTPGEIESFNGGSSWQSITADTSGNGPHSDEHATAFDANGNLIVGNDGGVFKLSDPTSSTNQAWTSLNTTNLQITQFTGIGVDTTVTNVVYGGSQDNGTEKYTGSPGWSLIQGGDGGITRVDPTDNMRIYQEFTNVSLQVSNNGGSSFTPITTGIVGSNSDFYVPYVLDASGNIYYGTDYLNFSNNQGSSWSQIGTPGTAGFNPNDVPINAIAVSPTDNNVIYVSAGDKVFVTQNHGTSWTQIDLPGGLVSGSAIVHNTIAVDPSDATGGTAYAVVNSFTSSGNQVFKTTNFGTTWTPIGGNLPDTPVDSVAVSPDGKNVYAGTDVGVYSTSNGGTTWAPFGSGFPNAQVVELEDVPSQGILVAGTHGRGAWEIATPPVLSVAKSGPATITAGANATYTITLTNEGPSIAQNVSLTDAVPSGTTFVSVTPVAGKNPDGFTYTESAGTVTGNASSVAAGDTDEFVMVVHANSNDANGSTITNTVNLSTTTTEGAGSVNTATVNSNVVTVTDLSIAKSASANITAGTNATYTIFLTNSGPSDAQNVSLTDAVPAGTTFVSATAVVGHNPDGFTYTESAGTVTGTPTGGVVAGGNVDELALVVHVPSNAVSGSTISNTASVSTTTTDPFLGLFGTTTVTSTVVTSASLAVVKSGPATATQGDQVTYTLTVTDNGPSDARDVVLTDALPAGLIFVSGTTSQGTITPSGGSVAYSLGTLADGATATATLVAQTVEPGQYTDTATVSSSTSSPTPNTPARATTTVALSPIALTGLTINGTEFAPLNNVTVATFTTANGVEPVGDFTATIAWGDGTTSVGTVVQSGQTYLVLGSHTYNTDGNQTIQVTVSKDGGALSAGVNSTVAIGEAALPAGSFPGPIANFVNETLEDLYNEQPSAGQINLLTADVVMLTANLSRASGNNSPIALLGDALLAEAEFASLATALFNSGSSLNTTTVNNLGTLLLGGDYLLGIGTINLSQPTTI